MHLPFLRRAKRSPQSEELSVEQQDRLRMLYGTKTWEDLVQAAGVRRKELNEEVVSLWYMAPADPKSQQQAATATVGLISRMRELEDFFSSFDDQFRGTAAPEPPQPKTISEYL